MVRALRLRPPTGCPAGTTRRLNPIGARCTHQQRVHWRHTERRQRLRRYNARAVATGTPGPTALANMLRCITSHFDTTIPGEAFR